MSQDTKAGSGPLFLLPDNAAGYSPPLWPAACGLPKKKRRPQWDRRFGWNPGDDLLRRRCAPKRPQCRFVATKRNAGPNGTGVSD